MQLGAAHLAVGETDQCHPLELPPALAAEAGLEVPPLTDGQVKSDRLDVLDLFEEFKIRLHGPTVTAGKPGSNKGLMIQVINPRQAERSERGNHQPSQTHQRQSDVWGWLPAGEPEHRDGSDQRLQGLA